MNVLTTVRRVCSFSFLWGHSTTTILQKATFLRQSFGMSLFRMYVIVFVPGMSLFPCQTSQFICIAFAPDIFVFQVLDELAVLQ